MITANGLLSSIKQNDDTNIGIVTLISMDLTLARLVAVWPSVGRMLSRVDPHPFETVPESLPPEDHMRWLWSRVEPAPEPVWACAAGLPYAPHVQRAMRTLQDNGVVFPDGTMSQWATKFMIDQARRQGVKQDEEAAT